MVQLVFTSLRPRNINHRSVRAKSVAHIGTHSLQNSRGSFPERAFQAIISAVSGPTCESYKPLANEKTILINPPWSSEARTVGIGHAQCGVLAGGLQDVHVEPIATSFDNGSGFILWERVATSNSAHQQGERICGVTFVEEKDDEASIIAVFRQPTPMERQTLFKEQSNIKIRPGKDNFFYGKPLTEWQALPAESMCKQTMLSAVERFYSSFSLGKAEEVLAEIASTKLHILEPMWEEEGEYLPVNRVEAAMWIERKIKNEGGSLTYTPKAISHVPETNMVFALWVAEGKKCAQVAGIHLFFFNDQMQISHISAFREPFTHETATHLSPVQ